MCTYTLLYHYHSLSCRDFPSKFQEKEREKREEERRGKKKRGEERRKREERGEERQSETETVGNYTRGMYPDRNQDNKNTYGSRTVQW